MVSCFQMVWVSILCKQPFWRGLCRQLARPRSPLCQEYKGFHYVRAICYLWDENTKTLFFFFFCCDYEIHLSYLIWSFVSKYLVNRINWVYIHKLNQVINKRPSYLTLKSCAISVLRALNCDPLKHFDSATGDHSPCSFMRALQQRAGLLTLKRLFQYFWNM